MPRPLSNPEWAAFMQSPNPATLNFPPWGGVVNWGGTGQYVLCFQMPSDGSWALSDITDGVPWGGAPGGSGVVPVQQYLQTVNSATAPDGSVFWNALPANFMQSAINFAAQAGALATQGVTITAQTVGQALQSILGGAASGLQPLGIPIALVEILIILFLIPRK